MPAETDLETTLLGPVLAGRDCGACTACCTALTVSTPEFSKSAGTPCVHLCAQGCAIHAARPHICRTWFCAWRRLADLSDEARPDRSGLLVSLNFERAPRNCLEAVSLNVRLLPGYDPIESDMARVVLDVLCTGLVAVWFSDGSKKILMHPEPGIAGYVISGEAAPVDLADEVAAWRERYAAFTGPD